MKESENIHYLKKFMKNKETLLLFIILSIFLTFGLYLSFNINVGISPDENYHLNVSKAYSKTWLMPENTEETYVYGDITRLPYLSFWLNARLINSNFVGIQDFIILRLFNLVVSSCSLVIVYLISREVINRRYFNVIPVFLLANTLMFVFLSSAINYDNLSNFFIYLSIYFFARFFKYKKSNTLLYLIISQILALLTKFTIAPIVLIEFVLIIVNLIKSRNIKKTIQEAFEKYKILSVIVLILLLLGILLYGINVIKFGGITPSCDRILTEEQCMHNALFVRNMNLEKSAIRNIDELKNTLKARITPLEYLSAWIVSITQKVYGIMGHKALLMNKYFVNIYLTIFGILTLTFIRKWRSTDSLETKLTVLSIFYLLILLIYHNYISYLQRGVFELALQGRYLFPVLPLIYILLIRYLKVVNTSWIKMGIIIIILLVFVLGCIPFFFTFVPNDWFV
jgi:hypothetical protein